MTSELTQDEVGAINASNLDRKTPFLIQGASYGYFSVACYCGGCTFNGASYTYLPETDELIRDDVRKFIEKLRKSKNPAAKKKRKRGNHNPQVNE